jgi:FKBP-type peptidyl-prolyl cis-trans isomerase (trigger factor)
MKWEQHDSGDGSCRLKVEANWSELFADYEDIVDRYAKVRMPGFRPGKTPRSVVEQRFQNEISDDLSHSAVQRFGIQAVLEAGIQVLGPAEAEEVECAKGRGFRAVLRFHPMPEIDLPDLGSLGTADAGGDPLDHISLRLLELVRFEIPEPLVKEELALDGIYDGEPRSAEWQAASERIRLMVILKRIANQEGIEVDEMDVNARIVEKAEEFGTTKKSLRAELEKGGGMQRLRDMLLAESTLDYLMDRNSAGR